MELCSLCWHDIRKKCDKRTTFGPNIVGRPTTERTGRLTVITLCTLCNGVDQNTETARFLSTRHV
jgi:hypothetical protein